MAEFLAQDSGGSSSPAAITARRSSTGASNTVVVETPNYDYHYLCADLRDKRMVPILTRIRARSLAEFGELIRHQGEEFVYVLEGCIEVHLQFYTPLTLQVGQELKVLNSDGVLHNVHALPKVNGQFNMAMPATRKDAEHTFDKAEPDPFTVKCDVHPWMTAHVSIFEHPYFGVTKDDGKFKLADLPAGTYEIEAWHEKLGSKIEKVTVADGESKTVDFKFTAPSGN